MAGRWSATAVTVLALTAASAAQAQYAPNGAMVYPESFAHQTIPCWSGPVILSGSHTSIRMTGACSYVRVDGEHNDVTVPIVPGGTIDIVGQHNDVTWHQVGRGPRPNLRIFAPHNDFHPPA